MDVTIPNGDSVSNSVELKGALVGIFMPAAWTAAAITLEASIDGANFLSCYDANGQPMSISAAADRFIVVAPQASQGVRYLRLRSGSPGAPIVQAAARTLRLEIS